MKTFLLSAFFCFVSLIAFGKTEYYGIKVNELFGFIDSQGEIVVEPQFSSASTVTSHGSAHVKRGEEAYFLQITSGEEISIQQGIFIIPIGWRGFYPFVKGRKEGIIHSSGEVIMKATENFSLSAWLHGLTTDGVFYLDFNERKEFFTIEGMKINFIKPPDVETIFRASRDYIITVGGDGEFTLWKKTNEGWDPLFKTSEKIYLPSEGRVLFHNEASEEYGFFDLHGNEAFSRRFQTAYSFANGYAFVIEGYGERQREYFINQHGQKAIYLDEGISPIYISLNFLKDYAIVKKGEFFGAMTSEGKFLIEPFQDRVWSDVTKEGPDLIHVQNGKKMAWFNLNGEAVWQSDGFKLRTEAP